MKITGANQTLPYAHALSDEIVPDQCSSMPKTVSTETDVHADADVTPSTCPHTEVIPTPVSPGAGKKSDCLEDIQRLTDEELEFDEFLLDAAEWL